MEARIRRKFNSYALHELLVDGLIVVLYDTNLSDLLSWLHFFSRSCTSLLKGVGRLDLEDCRWKPTLIVIFRIFV